MIEGWYLSFCQGPFCPTVVPCVPLNRPFLGNYCYCVVLTLLVQCVEDAYSGMYAQPSDLCGCVVHDAVSEGVHLLECPATWASIADRCEREQG